MRKPILFLIVVMLVMGYVQIDVPWNNSNVEAGTPDDLVDGLQYIQGDWIVSTPESYTDEIIVLSGNLTIEPTGSLTLRNVTVAINCTTENGTYTIEVMGGGSLDISDGDDNPATTLDRSNITDSPFDDDDGGSGDFRTAIKVNSGASLSIENTIIRECGYSWDDDNVGLYLDYVDDVNIQNCTFENGWYGLYSRWGNNYRIGYNEFRYFKNYGLYLNRGNYAEVYNNIIHHNDYGAWLAKSYMTACNNYIHNNSNIFESGSSQFGLNIQWASNCQIYNNTVEYNGNNWGGYNLQLLACSNIEFYNNTVSNAKLWSGYSIHIYQVSNSVFHNNSIVNNTVSGIYFYTPGIVGESVNNKFIDNNISNNNGIGMYLNSWGDGSEVNYFLVKNNTLINNSVGMRLEELRTYNITNNLITQCSGTGIYVYDVDGSDHSSFSNNTISATNYDFTLRDSNTIFKVLNCTCDPSKTDFAGGNPKLVILNFLHLNVTDDNSWVPGAYVVVRNNTDTIVFEGESDENGQIQFIKIKNQTKDAQGTIYYDPHNITATLDVHTAYGEIEPTMNKSQTVNVHFDIDLPPLPPANFIAVSNKTDVDLSWDSSKSTDVDHYLLYRNDTSGGWEIIYDSNDTAEEKATYWTDTEAASNWITYRYKVTAVDLLFQESQPSNIASCGDWIVNSTITVTNLTAIMNGSLTILSTGHLTLKNVKLQFNSSFNNEFGIHVEPGGKIWILDNDDNNLTTADRSSFSALDTNYPFFFIVEGSEIIMKNSKLSDCGWDAGLPYSAWRHDIEGPDVILDGSNTPARGLYIHSSVSNVEIRNNEFSENFVAVLLTDHNYSNITGNTFSNNTFDIYLYNSHNNTIDDNTHNGAYAFPIYLMSSRNNTITHNVFTNISNSEGQLVLIFSECVQNTITHNDFSGGKDYGIVTYSAGSNNNISSNNFSDQGWGIFLRYTPSTFLFDNHFDSITIYDCDLRYSDSATISGGTSNWGDGGYYLYNSDDVDISNVLIENATGAGVQLSSSNLFQMTNATIKSSETGVDISQGWSITLDDIQIEDCTTGIDIVQNPTNIRLKNSIIHDETETAIKINTIENLIINNCSLNATTYNFNLQDAKVTSYNTTFDQTKITLDSTSHISFWWLVNVRVFHWLGNPQENALVQIRNVAGTIKFEGFTDSNGYTGWVWVQERIQFSNSKESYTPHSFHAFLGSHAGSNGIQLNQSTVVPVLLENIPPQVSNVIIDPSYPTTTDDLNLSYLYSDDEGDLEGSTMIIWYIDGVNDTSLNNLLEINASNTSKGQTWFCEVIPHDGTTYGIPMTSTPVSIQNTPPEVSLVTIKETNPTSSDNLHVNYTFYDIDGDLEAQSQYRWYVNDGSGYVYSGVDSLELDSSYTKKGDLWKCIVTPNDGDDLGTPEQSPEVLIDNSAPEVSNVIILPVSPKSNESLIVNYTYFDLDNDLESGSTIRWYKDNVEQWNLNDSISVDSSLTLKGETWHYIITPSDGEDFGVPIVSDPITIGNTPPSVSNITISPLDPTTEDDLSVSYDFFDNDGDDESLDTVVKWLRWSGSEYFDTGLRGKNLSAEHTHKGERWTCEVIPHDGINEGLVNRSSMNVTINNSAPEVLSANIIPSNPTSDSDLEVDYVYFDVDMDLESESTIRWYKNNQEQWNLNDSTIVDSSLTLKGEIWHYIITPSDGEDVGDPFISVTITIGNTPPYVKNITIAPLNPDTEDILKASYEFYDNDGDSESLDTVIKWLRWSGSDYFDTGLRGKNLSAEHTHKGERWTCEVIPHDGIGEGLVNRSSMNVTINNSAPVVLSAYITPTNPTSDSDLVVDYDYWDVDSDLESGSTIRWYKNNQEQWNLNDSTTVDSSLTLKGEIWHYIITPSDGEDVGDPFISVTITIGNTPPYVLNITIAPLDPDTEDVLKVSYEFHDSDGDSESLDTVVKWLRWSGSEYFDTGLRGKNLSAEHTQKGERWTCEVIPHDGISEGLANRSDMNVTIVNSEPWVSDAYITPSEPTADSDLLADYQFNDPDMDLESGSKIRWYKNGVEQWNLNDSLSVDHSLTWGNEEWYYNITPSDGVDFGPTVQSEIVTIGNTPPYVSNVTISPLNPDTEDDLTVTYDYNDTDGDSESLDTVIRWLRKSGSIFFDTGLRGKTLPSEYTSKGEVWICEVIPHDGIDAGAANRSSMNVTIGNTAPSVINAYVTPSSPTADSDLIADYDYFDPDDDLESGSKIRWYKNGVEQWNLNDSISVDHSLTQGNEVWYYNITPSDGEDNGALVQSDFVVIGNTPPYVTNIIISPSNPTTGDDLSVTYDFNDSDGDSESLNTTVKWLRLSGDEFFDTGLRGKTLSSDHTSKGETWTCQVIPHDGIEYGMANISSMNVSIGNSAPSVLDASVTPLNPTADSDLIADYDYFDPDDDLESGSKIRWYKNGMEQWNLNDSISVDHSLTQGNEVWYYNITPSDGEDNGTLVQSDFVVIGNTPPYVTNIIISPTNPTTRDNLTVTYEFHDSDGDSESLDTTIRWLWWNGIEFFDSGFRGKNLSAGYTSKGQNWTCEVVPHDGKEEGAATRSSMDVTIGNSAPDVSNAHIAPENPTSVSDLVANYDYFDPDGDSVNESVSIIRWYRNGFEQADLYGLFTVNYSKTLKGDLWYYNITPSDGEAYGTPLESTIITIGNTPPQVSNIIITPPNPTTEDDLIVSYDFYDSDEDPESLDTVVKWLKWSGTDFVDTGLRGKTLSSVHTSKNDLWKCEVRPSDGVDEGISIISDMMVTISNSPPIAENAYITPTNPTTESNLMANYDYSDSDSDPESGSEIVWYRDGLPVSGLDNQFTIPHNQTQKGQVWNFTLRPRDGYDFGTRVNSDSITIQNNPPTATGLSISPNPPLGDEDLVASYTFEDKDGDTEQSFEITWYKGVFEQDIDGLEVSFTLTGKDQLWYYELRVFDGEDWSKSYSSYFVVVQNSKPIVTAINPSTVQLTINETESLDFSVDAEDPDGDFLLFKWKLDKATVEDDEDYTLETDYESAGTYTLNLTVQDIGENSFALFYEWEILVEDVNRMPQIGGQQPVEKEHTMKEDTSLKFTIEGSDPDSEDIPQVTWYVDDVAAQTGGGSFTYHPDFTAAGDHVVRAEVNDGTDIVDHSWDVTVEDVSEKEEGEERMIGLTWDQWGIILEVFVIAGTGLLAFIGYRKIRKKKGALKVYMSEIDEISENKDEDPIGYENRLNELEAKINDEFKEGNIEDLHYLMLQEILTGKRGEVRRAAVAQKFEGLPEGVTNELDEMLEDGIISRAEYERFVATMSQTQSLTPDQRKELSRMIEKWEVEDKDIVTEEAPLEKAKPKEGKIDSDLDEIINSLDEDTE
ncbi:MAG: right-handed parallel beta-helix repeat-containing protein [Methanomassiliicoccales archaeon]|nr:MAG: right-handed parallel beta-helix repeat-containing protein [Methanomassiliicoccales archaeon]